VERHLITGFCFWRYRTYVVQYVKDLVISSTRGVIWHYYCVCAVW